MRAVALFALLAAPAWAAAPSAIYGSQTFFTGDTVALAGLGNPNSVTVTAEGDIAVGSVSPPHLVLILSGSDLTVKDISYTSSDDVYVGSHPSGNLVVADQGLNTVALYPTSGIPGTTLASTTPVSSAAVTGCPSGNVRFPIAQQTVTPADAAVFTHCSATVVCKYSSLLGTPVETCKTDFAQTVASIALSPDDSYLLAFEHAVTTLYKLDSSDLSVIWSLDIDTLTTGTFSTFTSATNEIAIRSDNTAVVPDVDNSQLVVLDVSGGSGAAPSSATEIGLTGGCLPENTYTTDDGTGDVVVLCEAVDTYIVLDNTLDTANQVTIDLVESLTPSAQDSGLVYVGDGFTILMADSGDAIAVYGTIAIGGGADTESATQTQTATHSATPSTVPGSVGDPVLVDIHGHRFIAGHRGRSEYLLYESGSGSDRITMTTGTVRGAEDGFFVRSLAITREGCGTLVLEATSEHRVDTAGPECFDGLTLAGEGGMVVYSMASQAAAVVMPHEFRGDVSSDGFLNIRFAGVTEAFKAGCHGMVCDEAHADQLVL